MPKRILFGKELHIAAEATMRLISKAVKSTLGPSGKLALLDKKSMHLPSLITKDGVTVARHCLPLEDPIMNIIAEKIIEVAEKTNQEAGDGPQPLHSKILTPNGFVNMGYLRVGMKICGTNGSIQRILGIFPKGNKEIYEVEFENGGIVECCKDHLWFVTDSIKNEQVTLPIKEIMKNYIEINAYGGKRYRYYAPITNVEFDQNNSELPLDPYLVGVLIGDGCLRESGSIELSLGKRKEHIIEKLRLPSGIGLNISYVENKNYFRIKLSGKDKDGRSIRDMLKSLGLSNTNSKSKFIPKSYLYSSKSTRTALLQGLIDTDGYYNCRGLFEYSTVSSELADNFVELARSLGKTVYKRLHVRAVNDKSYSNTPIYRIQELKGYKYGKKIVRITPTDKYTHMQCIKVSNPDNLYITNHYNVTHNTTTAIVLAEAIYLEALKYLKDNDAVLIKREIEHLVPFILKSLDKRARPIKTLEQMVDVATISSNNDSDIGSVVAKAIDSVGQDGYVTLEEGDDLEPTIRLIEGFQVSKGASDIRLLKGHNKLTIEKPYILVYDGKLDDAEIIHNIWMSYCQGKGKSLVVIAELDPSPLKYVLINVIKSGVSIMHVPPPMYKDTRHKMLTDIALAVGAKLIDPNTFPVRSIAAEHLGQADIVEVTRYETTIINGHCNKQDVLDRIVALKEELDSAKSEYDRDIIRERIGRLTTGVAIIGVGGKTEDEMKERKDRFEDALNATRAALLEGIIPGGGEALLRISQILPCETMGGKILKEALMSPFKQIVVNTGGTVDSILQNVMTGKNGYDAKKHSYCNMMRAGIIDPVKVTKSALTNAVSIVDLLINLEVLSVDIPSSNPLDFLDKLKGEDI